MRTALTIIVAGILACSFVTYAGAQAKFGMGVELENQHSMIVTPVASLLSELDMGGIVSTGGLGLTPAVLFTIQMNPQMLLEPSIGYHQMGWKDEYTGGTDELTASDLSIGIGMVYALKPNVAVSPMLHPLFAYHMLDATYEVTGGTGAGKVEASASAFQVGLGIGGLINLKETVYLTAEARLLYTSAGDVEIETLGFTDDSDTSESMFDTDMVVGLRFVF